MMRRGFTLIELLVAALVASILMIMVYQVYIRAAKSYRVQNMALEMQAQVRFGLEHLRRDVANAGFGGTTNSVLDSNLCMRPPVQIRALRLKKDDGAFDTNTANANIRPMSITLFGDYSGNGRSFRTASVSGSVITLSRGDSSIPNNPDDFQKQVTKAEFDLMFKGSGTRYVRLVDKEQFELLVPVASADYTTGTITTETTLPVRSGTQTCGVSGFGEGMEINSAHFIRYRITKDTRKGAAAGKFDLVRQDIKNDGITPLQGSKLVIAEYAIDMYAYDFVFDNDQTGKTPTLQFFPQPNELIINPAGAGMLGNDSIRVQDLRMLTLKLTVRTSMEDPDKMNQPRTAVGKPIHTYDVDTTLRGAARTMTFSSKVMLNTLALRNVVPQS